MKFAKFTYIDAIILVIFALLLYQLLSHWDDYTPCPTPINKWLFGTYIFIAIARLLYTIIKTTEDPRVFKITLIIGICFILPTMISWSALGSIWFTVNNQTAPNCVPQKLFPFLTVWWIGLCVFVALIIIISIVMEVKKFRRNRRILGRFQRILQNDDVIYSYFATQNLITADAQPSLEEGLINREIDYLQQYSFEYNEDKSEVKAGNKWSGIVGDKEICSICLNNYVDKERLCVVPSCHHIFHEACLNQWVIKCPSCPYCKENIRNTILDLAAP